MAPQDSKIAVEILQSVNNRTQSLREIAYYAWLLLTYIVINTVLGRVTRHPAGMHCPVRDDAFVSSFVVFILANKVVVTPVFFPEFIRCFFLLSMRLVVSVLIPSFKSFYS